MARGDGTTTELSDDERARLNAVISQAEEDTGLEYCVLFGSRPRGSAREEAERVFSKFGLQERPGVLVMVVPHARTLEVVTAPGVHERLSDNDCDEAVRLMTGIFATGDIVGGLERGVQFLADRAGGDRDGVGHHGLDLPNVVDLDDPERP